ncbi:MAG TPA: DUF1501 domain-containing protein [Planctomycetota bacterium]
MNRRDFLAGFGSLALCDLLRAQEKPHHAPKAKRVIQLFMNGGASPMDLFDYKPELEKRHGETFDPGSRVEATTSNPGKVMKSPYAWKRHGKSGRWVSSILPHLAGCVDDMAFLMAQQSKTNVHGPGVYLQTTGFLNPGFPCLGAWVSYGLGSLDRNLPTFVVIPDARGLPYNSKGSFSSGFLPVTHTGTIIQPGNPTPIADLFPPKDVDPKGESDGLLLLERMNRAHAQERPGDGRLEARIASYELAARMQLSAPDVADVLREPEAIQREYGLHEKPTQDFGRACLAARRMIERGVRFVQVWSGTAGATGNWDNHGDIPKELGFIATSVDKPIAALLRDLKRRGMLEDTLVIWTTEFGRMPFTQGSAGRDHNGGTFVTWLAGAGVRAGASFGESDPWAWKAAKDVTSGYDLHATVMHLLGVDHEKLIFRHNGSDRRLTDVHGHVIKQILA